MEKFRRRARADMPGASKAAIEREAQKREIQASDDRAAARNGVHGHPGVTRPFPNGWGKSPRANQKPKAPFTPRTKPHTPAHAGSAESRLQYQDPTEARITAALFDTDACPGANGNHGKRPIVSNRHGLRTDDTIFSSQSRAVFIDVVNSATPSSCDIRLVSVEATPGNMNSWLNNNTPWNTGNCPDPGDPTYSSLTGVTTQTIATVPENNQIVSVGMIIKMMPYMQSGTGGVYKVRPLTPSIDNTDIGHGATYLPTLVDAANEYRTVVYINGTAGGNVGGIRSSMDAIVKTHGRPTRYDYWGSMLSEGFPANSAANAAPGVGTVGDDYAAGRFVAQNPFYSCAAGLPCHFVDCLAGAVSMTVDVQVLVSTIAADTDRDATRVDESYHAINVRKYGYKEMPYDLPYDRAKIGLWGGRRIAPTSSRLTPMTTLVSPSGLTAPWRVTSKIAELAEIPQINSLKNTIAEAAADATGNVVTQGTRLLMDMAAGAFARSFAAAKVTTPETLRLK